MKVEAHIKIEKGLLDEVDRLSGGNHRSQLIEAAIQACLHNLVRANADASDVEIINENLEELSREALDVLDYQIPL